jgi:hypothetical protein
VKDFARNSTLVWNLISAAISKNYIVGIDTANAGSYYNATWYATYGTPNLLSYSILGCYYLKDSTGSVTNKLYLIRSPYGNETWKGVWKDSSSLWTTSFKSQVPYVNKN